MSIKGLKFLTVLIIVFYVFLGSVVWAGEKGESFLKFKKEIISFSIETKNKEGFPDYSFIINLSNFYKDLVLSEEEIRKKNLSGFNTVYAIGEIINRGFDLSDKDRYKRELFKLLSNSNFKSCTQYLEWIYKNFEEYSACPYKNSCSLNENAKIYQINERNYAILYPIYTDYDFSYRIIYEISSGKCYGWIYKNGKEFISGTPPEDVIFLAKLDYIIQNPYTKFPENLKKYEVYPWEMRKYQEFKRLYNAILNRNKELKEKWIRNMSGVADTNKLIKVGKDYFIYIKFCKPHACDEQVIEILYNPDKNLVYFKFTKKDKIIRLGFRESDREIETLFNIASKFVRRL